MKLRALIAVLLLASVVVFAQSAPQQAKPEKAADEHEHASAILPNPAFDTLKSLAGDWVGTYNEGKNGTKSPMNFRVISNGSGVMLTMDDGKAGEMITIFHPDRKDLIATHYCAARNQPRMKLTSAPDPKVLKFDFLDVTNAAPGDGYMTGLVIKVLAPDHHVQEWTFKQGGKEMTAVFDVRRK